jgi:hypothetical protein
MKKEEYKKGQIYGIEFIFDGVALTINSHLSYEIFCEFQVSLTSMSGEIYAYIKGVKIEGFYQYLCIGNDDFIIAKRNEKSKKLRKIGFNSINEDYEIDPMYRLEFCKFYYANV